MYRPVRFPSHRTCLDKVKKKNWPILTFKNIVMQDIRLKLHRTRISL